MISYVVRNIYTAISEDDTYTLVCPLKVRSIVMNRGLVVRKPLTVTGTGLGIAEKVYRSAVDVEPVVGPRELGYSTGTSRERGISCRKPHRVIICGNVGIA